MVPQTISVFVNNIPPNIHGRWLKQIFQHHGSVLDAFIPQRRSMSGRRYGFVRFSTWREANNAVERLNGAWLLDHRLDVKFAKLNEGSRYWRRDGSPLNDVFQRRCDDRNPSKETDLNRSATSYFKNRCFTNTDKREFDDPTIIGCDQTVSDDEQDEIEIAVQDLKWLETSVVASLRSPLAIQALQQRLHMEEYSPLSISLMGGSWVLINFESKETIQNLLADDSSWIKEWFYWLKPWSNDLISEERLTWIRLSKLPLHAWSEDVFKQVGNRVGKFILADESSVNKQRLDFARILVVLNNKSSVRNSLELRVNDAKFSINLEVENNSEVRLNQQPFTVQGRNSNIPASTNDSNLNLSTVQGKDSMQTETHILQQGNNHESPLENGVAASAEKRCQLVYDEMVATLNREKENGGIFERNIIDEILNAEVTRIDAKELTVSLTDPNLRAGMNTILDSNVPSEENRALCLVQYDQTFSAPTTFIPNEEQMSKQPEEAEEETNQITVVKAKKDKKFISVSAIQSMDEKLGKKNSISVKRKGPKNRKKTGYSRKKENKLPDYYSDIPSHIEDEITDEDIQNRNRALRREAQATLEVAKLLGLSPSANEEDIIRSLMEAEIEDMARSICREQ